jgi:hypothetical protein
MRIPKLKVGDRVKIARIPPQVERDRSRSPEAFAIFQIAVGRVYEIRGFGKYGHAELWLRQDGSEDETGGADSIWVEPAHLTTV